MIVNKLLADSFPIFMIKTSRIYLIIVLFDGKSHPISPAFAKRIAESQSLIRTLVASGIAGKKRTRYEKLTLTPILPVVFYHGDKEWAVSKTLDTLFGNMPQELTSFVPNYQYFLCDVTKINDEDIKGEPILQAGLMLLKYIFRQDISGKLLDIYTPLKEVEDQQKLRDFVETTLYYLSSAARQLDTDKLEEAVTEVLSEGGALMATLVEKLLEQGRQEVRQEEKRNGLLLGIQIGLDIKFGDEGMSLYQEIQKIQEMDILQAICDKIKAVSALAELRRIYQSPLSEPMAS